MDNHRDLLEAPRESGFFSLGEPTFMVTRQTLTMKMKRNEDWINNKKKSPADLTSFLMYTHDWLMGPLPRIHCNVNSF